MKPVRLRARIATLYEAEWLHILATLTAHGGSVSRTAETLGLRRQSLQRKLRRSLPRSMASCPNCGGAGFHRECHLPSEDRDRL